MVSTHHGLLFGLKRKEILSRGTTRMNLEKILLSEVNQSQRSKYCMIPPIGGTQISQVHRHRK